MQSLIRLVPKAEGQLRLIFHVSFKFGSSEQEKPLNYLTPVELSTVKNRDLDFAVKTCLAMKGNCFGHLIS